MTTTEYRARLAEDAMRLEACLGDEFDVGCRERLSVALMNAIPAVGAYDCALDIVVEDRSTKDRVRLLLLASQRGYRRLWDRRTGV